MLTILVVVLLIVAIGGLPTWGYHSGGYGPSGVVGLLLVLVVLWMLFGGRLH